MMNSTACGVINQSRGSVRYSSTVHLLNNIVVSRKDSSILTYDALAHIRRWRIE